MTLDSQRFLYLPFSTRIRRLESGYRVVGTSNAVELDFTAADMWGLLLEGQDPQQVARVISERHGQALVDVRSDLNALIEDLVLCGALATTVDEQALRPRMRWCHDTSVQC